MDKNKRDLEELIKDLIWLQGVTAIEIIRIAENMAEATRGAQTQVCREEHQEMLRKIVKVLKKYSSDSLLKEHIQNHR